MTRPHEIDRHLRNSILDLMYFYSIFNIALSDLQILTMIGVINTKLKKLIIFRNLVFKKNN